MTVGEALERAALRLQEAGLEGPHNEAAALLGELLGVSRSGLLLSRTRVLTDYERGRLEAWLRRREAREPLQHITGVAHFYGLRLRVTPDVLVPRPETERLVEIGLEAVRAVREPMILDVGTGSGAAALALKAERPDAEVWATDLSGAALEVARQNVKRLGLAVTFVQADLLAEQAVAAFAMQVDLLVANLPYLPEADAASLSPEVQRDPKTALFSGHDGLDHARRLLAQGSELLKPGAVGVLELDPRNVRQAETQARSWAETGVLTDLVGRERFLRLEK